MNVLNRCFIMNPEADKKIMIKIVARAITDSLDHDVPARELGMIYVPLMVSTLNGIAFWLPEDIGEDLPFVAALGSSRSKICIIGYVSREQFERRTNERLV
jgi:hypothetical protein